LTICRLYAKLVIKEVIKMGTLKKIIYKIVPPLKKIFKELEKRGRKKVDKITKKKEENEND
tara:strand:- start:702 stop:884 length:183 start_codon:yes stop_codon:yes gene_type:complete